MGERSRKRTGETLASWHFPIALWFHLHGWHHAQYIYIIMDTLLKVKLEDILLPGVQ